MPLRLMIRVDITSNETYGHYVSPDIIHCEKHDGRHSVAFLPQMCNLNLVTRTHQTNPN